MKITVHTFSTDDDDGLNTQVFGSEEEANSAAWDWCLKRCDQEDLFERKGVDIEDVDDLQGELKKLYPEWTDLYELKGEPLDTCTTSQEEIDVGATQIFGLADWQGNDGGEAGEPTTYSLKADEIRLDVVFEGGESIWVERQNGRIRVHCYHPQNDSPVNVEIYSDRIDVDWHDHNQMEPQPDATKAEV